MKRILTFLFLFSSLFASSQTQFLGAPNTTIIVKGNMKVDSILYLPKRSKTPTDTGALRYQISDSSLYVWTGSAWRKAKNDGTVTSVGLTMPTAFAVANSPVTSAGTLAVTATGSATEYIRGDGTLGTLPTSGGGGGSGVNYYLNGSVSQGTIGGSTYYEMNKVPVVGTGTNFTASADGLIAQFITDAGDPNRLLIPAGAWNFELYFSASSAGGTPTFYVELLKYDGTTFTSIASSSTNPIPISNGTVTSLYVASLAVTETVLTATDRLAIRVYTNVSGRTITLHTEDNNLAQVITTFAGGVVSLNGLTANDQFFATGTTGTNFNIASTSATHTFNLPTASATNRGALSSTDWSTFNNKVNISDTAAMLTNYIRHAGNGLTKTGQALSVDTSAIATRSRVQKGIDSVASVRVGGSGITGYIPKWTALRTQDTSQLFQSAGFVGIGNTSPAYKLDITGTLRNTTGAAFATSSGNVLIGTVTDGGVYKLDVQGALRNTTGANFATSSGGVGIGTTSTLLPMQIARSLSGSSVFGGLDGDANAFFIRNNFYFDPVDVRRESIASGFSNQINLNNQSGFIGFELTPTSAAGANMAVTLQEAGRFVPTGLELNRQASVGGTIAAIPTDLPNIRLAITDTAAGVTSRAVRLAMVMPSSLVSARNYLVTGVTSGENPYFAIETRQQGSPNAVIERVRITGDGNFGIGNTAPSEKLHVTGRIRATTIDSTATGMNMLYADATGVIKKAAVPSGGGGSVTSITAGTGLTGGTITTSGTIAVDTASVATRARVQKGIDSVTTLANTKLSGTGITGYFPKWTGTSSQDTSQLFQLGRNIGIGTSTPAYRLHLPDAGATANQAMIAGTIFGSDGNGVTISPNSSNITIKGGQGNGSIYSGTISSVGRWGINTTSLNDAVVSINGDVKIVTIDSTSTARNMLYQDANGVIKKAAVPSGGSGITGSGTASYLPKWTSGSAIGNSVAYDNGGEIIINSTSDAGDFKLQVVGNVYTSGTITTQSPTGDSAKPWKLGSRQAASVSLDTSQYIEVEVNGVYYRLALVTVN